MNHFYKNSRLFLFFIFIFLMLFGVGCKHHNSLEQIDTTGPIKAMATLEEVVVDQLSFSFVKEEFDFFNPEIYVVDAETGRNILCVHPANSNLSEVDTKMLIYGNLNAQLKSIIQSNYSAKLFSVKMYLEDHNYCVVDDADTFVGETPIVNFDSLISRPLMSTNGRFFVRLKNESAPSAPLPKTVSSDFFGEDKILLDQFYMSPDAVNLYNDDSDDIMVFILNADTEETLAYSSRSDGLRIYDSVTSHSLSYGRILADVISDGTPISFSSLSGTHVKLHITGKDLLGESEELSWDDLPGKKITFKNADNEEIGFVTYTTLGK